VFEGIIPEPGKYESSYFYSFKQPLY
jgi:hypothetical protein